MFVLVDVGVHDLHEDAADHSFSLGLEGLLHSLLKLSCLLLESSFNFVSKFFDAGFVLLKQWRYDGIIYLLRILVVLVIHQSEESDLDEGVDVPKCLIAGTSKAGILIPD